MQNMFRPGRWEMRDEKQQEDYLEGLSLQAAECEGDAVGPRKPQEIIDQERAWHLAILWGLQWGLGFQPSPNSMHEQPLPTLSPGFPEAQLHSENHGGRQTAAGLSDTSTTYKSRGLSDVP